MHEEPHVIWSQAEVVVGFEKLFRLSVWYSTDPNVS